MKLRFQRPILHEGGGECDMCGCKGHWRLRWPLYRPYVLTTEQQKMVDFTRKWLSSMPALANLELERAVNLEPGATLKIPHVNKPR